MSTLISLTANSYVPFEPRTQEQRATRLELRRRLSELEAAPGEILSARFAGGLPAGADVENAVFYNLDAAGVFGAMARGASFEMDPRSPTTGVRYEYEVGGAADRLRHWLPGRVLASFGVRLGDAQPKLASIWWALRSVAGAIRTDGKSRAPTDPFIVILSVQGPVPRLTPALLKTVLDGTICGLQSQSDSAQAAAIAPAIAGGLGAAPEGVLRALTDDSLSALGARTRFAHRHGAGVKWEPDDDRCVAARVLFASADAWQIEGSASLAIPRPPVAS